MKNLLLILLVFSTFAAEAKEPNIYKYCDGQGQMSQEQLTKYLQCLYLANTKPNLSSPDDFEVIKKHMSDYVTDEVKELGDSHILRNGSCSAKLVYQEIHGEPLPRNTVPNPDPDPKSPPFANTVKKFLYIRRTTSLFDSDFTVSKDNISSETKADGALFSYNRNFSTDQNTWNAQGVIELPIRSTSPGSQNTVQEAWFLPAVVFNRLGGGGVPAAKKIDSLAVNLGTFLAANSNDWGTLLFRGGQVTQTDFSFKSLLIGGEADFEYVNKDIFLGNANLVGVEDNLELFSVMQRLVLHVDGGEVFDTGDKTSLHAGDAYSRMGPLYRLDLFPGTRLGLSRKTADSIKLEFSYGYYMGLLGKAYQDYQTSLNWAVGDDGTFGLAVIYEHGGLNPNGDTADQVTVGITIKQ